MSKIVYLLEEHIEGGIVEYCDIKGIVSDEKAARGWELEDRANRNVTEFVLDQID